MCGRFNVIDNPGLQQLLHDLGIDLKLPNGVNIAPTEQVSLVRATGELVSARWWLIPQWARQIDQKYAMFNARRESLTRSRAFQRPFPRQRGVVPMSSFIEWRKAGSVKTPFLVTADSGAIAAAALWDVWHGGETPLLSCTLVTTAAAPQFEPWHRRMPVLLTSAECEQWLDNSHRIDDDDPLFHSRLKMPLRIAPLDRAVGNARNKDSSLLSAVGEVIELAASA